MELLKRVETPIQHVIVTPSWSEDDTGFEQIRCPLCQWRPAPSSTWCCYNENTPEPPFEWCGTQWNTFQTAGRCPGCQHQWAWTSCLSCGGWSRHDDWYECG